MDLRFECPSQRATFRMSRVAHRERGTTLRILDAIRPGGTAVIVGMAALTVRAPISPYFMALHEKTLKGTIYGSIRPNLDIPQLVELYLDGRLKLDELISRTYTLDEINEGFAALRSGQVARGFPA